jgi:hypothetical protein
VVDEEFSSRLDWNSTLLRINRKAHHQPQATRGQATRGQARLPPPTRGHPMRVCRRSPHQDRRYSMERNSGTRARGQEL